MTALSDYIAKIRRWIDDEDEYDDATVTDWIRDGEERINNELRSVEQIVRTSATFDDNCAKLPPDWLEFIYVRAKGGRPLRYTTPDQYWSERRVPPFWVPPPNTSGEVMPYPYTLRGFYTTIGQTVFVWPPIDPEALTQIEICYFRKVAPLGATQDPIMDRYPTIYRNCVLSAAAPYMIEDERIQTWASLATAGIQKANEAAKAGRWSGSPMNQRSRGFG